MPEIHTRADSLRVYLSGAASDGGAQASPAAALGNYRGSTLAQWLGILGGLENVSILFASGLNGSGEGALQSDGEGNLRWTAPGGTSPGSYVAVGNGETKILEDRADRGKFLVVGRSGSAPAAQTRTIVLTDVFNNLWNNVPEAESAAGADAYRGLILKNESEDALSDLILWIGTLGASKVSAGAQLGGSGSGTLGLGGSNKFHGWPRSGFVRIEDSGGTLREIAYYASRTDTQLAVPAAGRGLLGTSADAGASDDLIYPVPGLRIGVEAPSAQPDGYIQTIADENTEPAGISWETGITAETGLVVGSLAAGEILGLWVHRAVIAGHAAAGSVRGKLKWTFGAAA
ncbi:MAG: hypothetical protein KIS92_04525 [Planctomycetota bacterium]|nr:hypothetical protein [Planctomycetota bacterium]